MSSEEFSYIDAYWDLVYTLCNAGVINENELVNFISRIRNPCGRLKIGT